MMMVTAIFIAVRSDDGIARIALRSMYYMILAIKVFFQPRIDTNKHELLRRLKTGVLMNTDVLREISC